MPHEPARTEGRRASGTTLRDTPLWAVGGAALFLGIGASLPLWTVRAPAYVIVGTPTPAPGLGVPEEPLPTETRGSLWAAASATLDERRYFRGIGADVQLVRPDDYFIRDALLLLGAGAVVGLIAHRLLLAFRRRGAVRP